VARRPGQRDDDGGGTLAVLDCVGDGFLDDSVRAERMLPIVVSAFPGSLQYQIERFLPLEIGSAMINDPSPDAFSPWAGFFILCGYTLVVLALATIALVRRDA
jgi:hypothetical protein